MFRPLYDRIVELEIDYNSWMKEYIEIVLKKISNSTYVFPVGELKACNIKIVVIEKDIVEDTFKEFLEKDDDIKFKNLYRDIVEEYVPHYNSPIPGEGDSPENTKISLKKIFRDSSLTEVEPIIKFIISLKELVKSVDPVNCKYVREYIDAICNNLVGAQMFVDMKEYMFDDRFIMNEIPRLLDANGFYKKNFYSVNEDLEKFNLPSSFEAEDETAELDDAKESRDRAKFVGKSVLRVKNVIDEGRLNVKHFMDKFNLIRNAFYAKNLGKIDHLYEHYGSSATVMENELLGDPVKTLMVTCPKYLSDLIDGLVHIYHSYNNHMNKLFNCKDFHGMIIEINNYLTLKDVKLKPEAKPSDVKKALVLDLRYKFANVLLRNNRVYGYTVDSITHQKYPPIDHVMICLFMSKPHSPATEVSVNSVFESADSFKIMSKEFKKIVLESSKIVINKMHNISIDDDYKKANSHISNFIQHAKMEIKTGSGKMENNSDQKKDLKARVSVLKDYRSIYESFVPLCVYVSEAGNAMYTIAMRVDKTCRDALRSMLNEERGDSDNRYKHDTSRKSEYQNTSVNKIKRLEAANEKKADSRERIKQRNQEVNKLRGYQNHGDDQKIKFF